MGNRLKSPSLLWPHLELGLQSVTLSGSPFPSDSLPPFTYMKILFVPLLLTHLLWFRTFSLQFSLVSVKPGEVIHFDLKHYQDNRAKGQNHQVLVKHIHVNCLLGGAEGQKKTWPFEPADLCLSPSSATHQLFDRVQITVLIWVPFLICKSDNNNDLAR